MTEAHNKSVDIENTKKVNDSLHQLIQSLRTTQAPQSVLEEVDRLVKAASEALAGHELPGPHCASNLYNATDEFHERAFTPKDVALHYFAHQLTLISITKPIAKPLSSSLLRIKAFY